ncbi:Hypp7411 [Branchiostoma lanceolatum]|uniref:Hypp7411 protein n=1 Tax=Branchiostoma lanceolatum TaxID=7740 RepID=A0A8J9Z0J1_BRALA|nr:Hypp7411 [Branchiostoma lanceolatum]
MANSLPTISDIKSISQEEFDRMSGSAPPPGSPDNNTAGSVSVLTRSLPIGVTPNTSITSGYRPQRSGPLPRTDKINTLKRKLQESQEAICTLKKLKQEGVMWSDNGDHPVDLTVTGNVGHGVHTFRPYPFDLTVTGKVGSDVHRVRPPPVGVVEVTSPKSPDSHPVTRDVSRSTRDALPLKQNPTVKKRRGLSEIVNSLTSKKLGHESFKGAIS